MQFQVNPVTVGSRSQIPAFDQVQWAILESNGTISFIQKAS